MRELVILDYFPVYITIEQINKYIVNAESQVSHSWRKQSPVSTGRGVEAPCGVELEQEVSVRTQSFSINTD